MTRKDALIRHKEEHLLKQVDFEIALEQIKGEDEKKVINKVRVPDKTGLLGKEKMVERNITIKDVRAEIEKKLRAEKDIIGVIDSMLD